MHYSVNHTIDLHLNGRVPCKRFKCVSACKDFKRIVYTDFSDRSHILRLFTWLHHSVRTFFRDRIYGPIYGPTVLKHTEFGQKRPTKYTSEYSPYAEWPNPYGICTIH